MNSSFTSLTSALKDWIGRGLPGPQAHIKMMPSGRDAAQRQLIEQQESNIRLGGVLILLFPLHDKICFPLTLRHEYGGVHSGQVSLPGGRMEENDKDLTATALRETEEEIGVPIKEINVIGELSPLYIPPSRYKITPVVAFTDSAPKFKIDPYEVKELIVAETNHILDEKHFKSKDLLVRGSHLLNTPYYDIYGQVVWGATGMILREFAHIIEDLQKDGLV